MKIKGRIIKKPSCALNTVFVKKAYMKMETTNDTVRALDKRAIVLIDETVKMF